jgi:hypothetical protein
MFLELLATVFAGIAAAGIVMLLNRLTGNRLPRWGAPVAAGLGMLAVTISMEYSWYARTAGTLPAGLVIADTAEKKSLYQPWTYLVPYVNRFVAIDTQSVKSRSDFPDQRLAELYTFGRWSALERRMEAFDCATGLRTVLTSGDEPIRPEPVNVGLDDPVLSAACEA